jgi:hypothetical protein
MGVTLISMPIASLLVIKREVPLPVSAAIIKKSAKPPSRTNVFWPFIMYESPSFFAVVSRLGGECRLDYSRAKERVIDTDSILVIYSFFLIFIPSFFD